MDEKDLKEMAGQLQGPHGDKGVEVAEMMNKTNFGMIHHSIHRLQLKDHHRILELGPGNGRHLGDLLSQRKQLGYFGLETSDLMVNEALRINQVLVEAHVASFKRYDGLTIPYPAHYFDRIFTVNTIYFWEKPEVLVTELYRVLKQGGLINITFAQADFMARLPFVKFGFKLYDTNSVEVLLKAPGFTVLQAESQTESVTSKTGEQVSREFTTVSAQKR
jgi:SAM-dependent methyltransferase